MKSTRSLLRLPLYHFRSRVVWLLVLCCNASVGYTQHFESITQDNIIPIVGISDYAGATPTYGGSFISNSIGGSGVKGLANGQLGNGLLGIASSQAQTGVRGDCEFGTTRCYGMFGSNRSEDSNSVGGRFQANQSATGIGVLAFATGDFGIGIETTGGKYAGYFIGNVRMDNKLVIGGAATPSSEMHVYHASTNGGGTTGLRLENSGTNGNWWNFYAVNASGNLSLFSKAGGAAAIGSFNGTSGVYTSLSDVRAKKNIEELEDVLGSLNGLKVKKYHFIAQSSSDNKSIGLIAQEVLRIFPELVSYSDETDRYHLDYASFSVVAIKAIQEQSALIKKQESEISHLSNLVVTINERIAHLESALKITRD